MDSLKIIVAHPGKQLSYKMASAFKKSGNLLRYCTTIYNKENAFAIKVLKKVKPFGIAASVKKKKNPDLEDGEVTLYRTFPAVLEAILYRIEKSKKLYTALQQRNAKKFGRKVAELAIKEGADAVVCYDSNAFECFRVLKKKAPNITRIMEVSHCARPYEKRLVEEEVARSGSNGLKKENFFLWNKSFMKNMQTEIDLADYFLTPSSFINNSLVACGVDPDKLVTVLYGSNTVAIEHEYQAEGPLRLLFVGNVNYNKGIPYLLKAMERFSAEEVTLRLVGLYNPKDEFVKNNTLKNVEFCGKLDFEEVCNIYRNSDVLVLNSFAEAMGQVGIEAMTCGLPIICSTNTGVQDIVTDGENGFIIEPGDADALAEKILWFKENRKEIERMGRKATKVGKACSWETYEQDINKKLLPLIRKSRGHKA